jgi:hypothetical protein
MGDHVIKKFLDDLKSERVRLEDAIARYSNQALLEIEAIRRDAEARGLDRERYVTKTHESRS